MPLFLMITFIIFLSIAFASISLAPWVPTWKKDYDRVIELADLKPGQTFYDLGCGTGRVVFAVGNIKDVKSIGIEISIPLYFYCVVKKLFLSLIKKNKQLANIIFKYKNLFKENLEKADVVYLFGTPGTLKEKITNKLKKELKPGARVISYAFKITGWKPALVSKPTPKDISIYLYKI